MGAQIENPVPLAGGNRADLIPCKGSGDTSDSRDLAQPITVVFPGLPVPKGRPRVGRAGRVFTPAKTRHWELVAGLAARAEMRGRAPFTGPCHVSVLIELPIPSSWSTKKKTAAIVGDVRPTSRPDLDNFVKSILDVLNGIVILDDAQVVELQASKRYGLDVKAVASIVPIEGGAP